MSVMQSFSTLVGPLSRSDGSYAPLRADKQGSVVVASGHAAYYEASSRGAVFSACEQGSGVAPGTTLGTTAALSLYNPPGSGKRLALLKVSAGYVSGTLGAGTLYHCINKNPAQAAPVAVTGGPPNGTVLTAVCNDVGHAATAEGVAIALATVDSGTVAYRPFASLNAMAAATATQPNLLWEDLEGEIVLEPGTSYQLQAKAAAGTSPLITFGCSWEEIALV